MIIAGRVIACKGFNPGDAILRAAIRDQVGSTVKRLHRNGAVENTGAGRASKWKLAGSRPKLPAVASRRRKSADAQNSAR